MGAPSTRKMTSVAPSSATDAVSTARALLHRHVVDDGPGAQGPLAMVVATQEESGAGAPAEFGKPTAAAEAAAADEKHQEVCEEQAGLARERTLFTDGGGEAATEAVKLREQLAVLSGRVGCAPGVAIRRARSCGQKLLRCDVRCAAVEW